MNLGNLTSMIRCSNCGFNIYIHPNQATTICEHCKTVINLNTINFNLEGENDMINKEEYKQGIKCKGMCGFCKDRLNCHQGQKYTEKYGSKIEMDVLPSGVENTDESITGIMPNKLKIRIKYFEGATKLQKIAKGNWIDVYANKDIFVPVGERAMIPLGFALELPQGWEGHLAPRSSTFKTWGVIQTNHVGIVDDTYIGDNDQWHMPIYCLQGKEYQLTEEEVIEKIGINAIVESKSGEKVYTSMSLDNTIKNHLINKYGTWIKQGDKIGQFRIMEVMPEIEFEEVESFGNTDRGGFGTTGVK